MKKSRAIASSLMISSLLTSMIPILMSPEKADARNYLENLCSEAVVGTYLATAKQTNSTSGQPSLYREIITFTADGNVIANDSTAGGVPGSSNPVDQPFGPVQGSWKCSGNNDIVVKVLNFGFPSGSLPGYIAFTNYYLKFNPQTRAVNGNLAYNLYNINSNPLDQNTKPLSGGPFKFSYQGVKLK
ncbi:MAG: hypothetical protein ACYTXE_38135 [Nostoc sp.]|uniref:hypothetical protein n=1 Tax=Nostoc sp. TaxID=1180 RepID=UPI002FF532E7